jgi:hypothetical protein
MLDPNTFEECFLRWMGADISLKLGTQINIDGETLRRSHQRSKGIKPLHFVSAFVVEQGLVLDNVQRRRNRMNLPLFPNSCAL